MHFAVYFLNHVTVSYASAHCPGMQSHIISIILSVLSIHFWHLEFLCILLKVHILLFVWML